MTAPLIDDSTGFDEPTEAAPAAATKAQLAITDDMGRISNALSEFDRVSAGLADLETRYPKDVIYEVGTTKGFKAAIEHRAAWRDPRITVEKVRKMAKAPLIALGKNIDARAAWLTEQLLEGEQPIDQQIKAEEARREAEREAKAAAEFGRVLAIQEAMAAIAIDVAAACAKTSDDIGALLETMQATQPDPLVFQEQLEQAKAAWAAGIAKLETAHKAKLWEEAEARRIAAEQEAQRIAAQRAAEEMERQRLENERIAAEQRAERERMAAERAELERQRAELQAEKDRAAAEAARVEREQREEAERQARELQEARERADRAEQAEESKRIDLERDHEAAQRTSLVDYVPSPAPAPDVVPLRAVTPAANETPTLTLGEIKTRIAPLSIDANGLDSLGFAAKKERGACLYRESQWEAMKAAMLKSLAASGPARKAA